MLYLKEPQIDAPWTHLWPTLHAQPPPPHSSTPDTGVSRTLLNMATGSFPLSLPLSLPFLSPSPLPPTLSTGTSRCSLHHSLAPPWASGKVAVSHPRLPRAQAKRETPNSRERRFSDGRFHRKERPKLACCPQTDVVSPGTLGN